MVMPKWEITCECDKEDEVLDLILKNRGIKDQETFFNPPPISYWVKNLSSDFKSNLKKSKEIVEKAISDSRPIIIYGDYDVDGICATAILFTTIKNELGYDKVYYFIPNRFRHGYGLSKEGIHECEKPNALFITVDSGITNIEEAEYLKKLNHQVVITDHHQQKSKLPEADCILWDDQIVGATVAWLLSKALGSKNSTNIALCGLATVTDLQPIIGFNRTLVKESLKILNNNLPAGFCKLLSNGTNEITSYELGWVLGPRLNASGRLGDASMSLNLLIESDIKKAEKIADSLNEINKQRQDKTLEMYELAATVFDDDPPTIIISGHDDYHEGIIGLVAAKLKQRFHRPSIVITTSGDVAKGSARSISGVNIIELLRNYESL
ncbi:MAG: DHH family phosphoesterase, partial [Gammaproteobacteria bacterium]|nr:DHH family phosphoesterase [Gammaproteobacteria bacterium]